jgi:hypothetical protein
MDFFRRGVFSSFCFPGCKNTFVCFQENTLKLFLLFANVLVLSRVIDVCGSILRVTILGDLFGRRQGHE